MVIYPYYAIMFSERSHLSTAQISALFGWWIIVALISELPTGTLADKFSRRTVIIFSDIFQALAFFIWLIAPNFLGYALGFLFWGIGFAFSSGALQAYVFDEMKALHETKLFTKVYSRSQSMSFAGMVCAYIVASIMGQRYEVALVLSIVISLASAYVASTFPKSSQAREAHGAKPSQMQVLKKAVQEVSSSKLLQRLVMAVAVSVAIGSAMEEYVPLYDKVVGVPIRVVPLVLALGLGLSSVFAWVAHHFESRTRLFGLISLAIAGFTLYWTSFESTIIAVGGIMLFMRLVKLSSLLYQSSLQHHVGEESRATVGSLPTFLSEILSLLIVGVYGFVARSHGNFASIRTVALGVVVASLLLAWFWRNYSLTVERVEQSVADSPEIGLSA